MPNPASIDELLASWDAVSEQAYRDAKAYRTNCNKDQRGLRIGKAAAYESCAGQLRALLNATDSDGESQTPVVG